MRMRTLILQAIALLAVACATAESVLATPVDDPKTYGELGDGHIRVETMGDQTHWTHPGIYWLAKDATLLDFVQLAGPKDIPGGEMPGDVWVCVWHEHKPRGRFLLRRIKASTVPGRFVLQDGDVLQTIPTL